MICFSRKYLEQILFFTFVLILSIVSLILNNDDFNDNLLTFCFQIN